MLDLERRLYRIWSELPNNIDVFDASGYIQSVVEFGQNELTKPMPVVLLRLVTPRHPYVAFRKLTYAVATDEQLARIEKVPKREFIRRGINQHTLEKICNREPVRAEKLANCLKVLEDYEEELMQKCTTRKG